MIILIASLLFFISGYALVLLTGLSKKSLLHDLPLAWFLGTGFYAFAHLLVDVLGFAKTGLSLSFAIIFFPVMLFMYIKRKGTLEEVKEVFSSPSGTSNLLERLTLTDKAMLGLSLFIFVIILLHGINTPISSDDALRIRAYHSILVYEQELVPSNDFFVNGAWSNYLPQLPWQLNGAIEPFFIKYLLLVSFASCLTLFFALPAIRGNVREGVYNVFLTLSLPFLIYHATSANLDLPLVMPFAVGFLCFSLYLKNGKPVDLNMAILFFTVSAFIKGKGDILSITGIGIIFLFILVESIKGGNAPPWRSALFLLPLTIYLALKNFYSSAFIGIFNMVVKALPEIHNVSTSDGVINGQRLGIWEKLYGFFHSLFLSGHFNVLFYLIVGNIIFFAGRIMQSKQLKWSLLFLSVLFFECFYYMVIVFDKKFSHQSIVHRVLLLLAVTGVVFLSSLWANHKKEVS